MRECLPFLIKYIFHSTDDIDLREFILTINQFIAPFNLEIKKGIQEEDGMSHYCLVCKVI